MNLTPASLKTAFNHFLSRFHVLVFTIVVLGGLVVCMLLINQIITQTGTSTSTAPSAAGADFDQNTINRIKQLHTADDSTQSNLDLSHGRINPFVD